MDTLVPLLIGDDKSDFDQAVARLALVYFSEERLVTLAEKAQMSSGQIKQVILSYMQSGQHVEDQKLANAKATISIPS